MNEGVFLINKHFRASPSTPPPPLPQQCNDCTQFTHTTENCKNASLCNKCSRDHRSEKCTKNLPIKCTACNTTDHVAWSLKCPKRPTKLIEGIPNTQIKPLNKRNREIDSTLTNNNRIHEPVTAHDFIINTYVRKINNPTSTNTEKLIQKLKNRFTREMNIDTTAVFSGNGLYILMVDLDKPEVPSPTQPLKGSSCTRINGS